MRAQVLAYVHSQRVFRMVNLFGSGASFSDEGPYRPGLTSWRDWDHPQRSSFSGDTWLMVLVIGPGGAGAGRWS
jgi:hypothetical protein